MKIYNVQIQTLTSSAFLSGISGAGSSNINHTKNLFYANKEKAEEQFNIAKSAINTLGIQVNTFVELKEIEVIE